MEHISKHLQVRENRDVVKLTNAPAPITEEERGLQKALEGKKVRDFTDEDFKPNMLYIYALVGLRGENYPKGLDKDFLHTYIREYYGGHTGEELRLAFTMAIQGKLGLETSEVKCYENFTVFYFSTILNAYRQWSKEAVAHVVKQDPPPALPAPQTTDEEFTQAVLTVYRLSRDYKSIPVLAYKVLESKMGLTRADKQRIYQKVHETTREGDLQELSRQYAVKEYFDKLIQEGTV